MIRIDFAFNAPDKLYMACKVTRKQYLAKQRLVVYCTNPVRLHAFDRLLWSFDEVAFVPHVLANDPLARDTPIVLTTTPPTAVMATLATSPLPTPSTPWLINLDDDCPPDYQVFPRLLEIVSMDEADRALARQRWRAYQAQGHDLHSHTLTR